MKTPQELVNSIKLENTLTEPALSNSNLSNEQQEKLNTSLLSSILVGNYGRTKELLDEGADVNTKDNLGNTPILNAISFYDAELVKLLIKAGADVNATAQDPKYSIKYISKNMRNSEKYISESKRNLEIINSLIKAGVNPTEVDSKFTTDNNIIGLFKEAIDQKDSPSIANLYKHFSEFRMDALAYANSQNNSEMVQFINKIHDEAEPKKITQIQLDILIANNNYKNENEINLKNLLEANHYLTDLSYLRINGDKFNQNLNKLDFSGLILSNSKLHNLSAREVLFVDSDLTNANINFKNSIVRAKADFTKANLIRSYISGMEMSVANFKETTVLDSIIINSKNADANLSKQQKLQIMDLVISADSYFTQGDLINRNPSQLNREGVCKGLCIELTRYILMAQEKGKGYGDYLEKMKRKIANPSMNFIYRVQSYQDHLQAREAKIPIKADNILNNNFLQAIPSSIEHSDILGCSVTVDDEGGHIFAVIKLRDENKNIIRYKIFDPNYGEINCQNELELNKQVNLLFQNYQRHATNRESTIAITALDDLVKKNGLINPKDVKLSDEEKIANKAKKYSKMSEEDMFYMRIESKKSTPEDIDKVKSKIASMSLEEINKAITLKDGSSTSLLMIAVKANNIEVVQELIKKGAAINTPNVDLVSPLQVAIRHNYTEIRSALIIAGADQNIKYYGGNITKEHQKKLNIDLIQCTIDGRIEQVKTLLDKGADVNSKNKLGNTPLMFAANIGNTELVKLFVKAGADVNAKSNNGKVAIKSTLESTEKQAIINVLIKAGADPTGVDSKFINDKVIIELLKEADKENDRQAIDNLIKLIHNNKFRQEFKINISNKDISQYAKPNLISAAAGKIVKIIEEGIGFVQDSQESWQRVERILKNLPEKYHIAIVNTALKEINNSSRKDRLLSFLPEDARKLASADIPLSDWHSIHEASTILNKVSPTPVCDPIPIRKTKEMPARY